MSRSLCSTCLLCKITISQYQVPREQASSSSSSEAPAVHSALTCTRASVWGGGWFDPNGAGPGVRSTPEFGLLAEQVSTAAQARPAGGQRHFRPPGARYHAPIAAAMRAPLSGPGRLDSDCSATTRRPQQVVVGRPRSLHAWTPPLQSGGHVWARLYNWEATCGPPSTIQADATWSTWTLGLCTMFVCFVPPQSWFKTTAVA